MINYISTAVRDTCSVRSEEDLGGKWRWSEHTSDDVTEQQLT